MSTKSKLLGSMELVERGRTLGRVYTTADTMLVGRRIKVEFQEGPLPSISQTDGAQILFDLSRVTSADFLSLTGLHGANFHEVAHILHSPRVGDTFVRTCRSQGMDFALKLLEDHRIENLLTARYPSTAKYLEAVISRWILGEPTSDQYAFLFTWGRKYLSHEMRDAARASFTYQNLSQREIARVADIIDEYIGLLYPADQQRMLALVAELHGIVWKGNPPKASPPDPFGHDKRSDDIRRGNADEREGRAAKSKADQRQQEDKDRNKQQSSKPKQSDGASGKDREDGVDGKDKDDKSKGRSKDADSKDSDEGDGAQGNDSSDESGEDTDETQDGQGSDGQGSEDGDGDEGDGEGQSGDGDSQGNSSGSGSGDQTGDGGQGEGMGEANGSGAGTESGAKGAPSLAEIANQAIESLSNDAEVMNEVSSVQRQIRNAAGTETLHKARTSDREVDDTGRKGYRAFSAELRRVRQQVDMGWDRRTDGGRINAVRYARERDRNTAFDQWEEGRDDALDIEAVILTDVSGSMGYMMQPTFQAMWAIKRALDDIDASTTVISYDTDAEIVYNSNEKASRTHVRQPSSGGGTTPNAAVRQALTRLAGSRRSLKIFITLTDGDWADETGWGSSSDQHCDAMIARMAKGGIITALGYITDAGTRKNLRKDWKPNAHGCEIAAVVTPENLAPFAKQIVMGAISKKLARR